MENKPFLSPGCWCAARCGLLPSPRWGDFSGGDLTRTPTAPALEPGLRVIAAVAAEGNMAFLVKIQGMSCVLCLYVDTNV